MRERVGTRYGTGEMTEDKIMEDKMMGWLAAGALRGR
jgi:hypothetical protein